MIAVATTIAVFTATPRAAAAQSECREWHECRQLALDAYTRGEYERFHDLAWRTVQTGPARDPNLMYLLARAQSLSGRPHDAVVMLGRVLDVGFKSDAATNDDFRAARQLPQWRELEARMAPVGTPALAVTTPAVSAPVSTDVALRVPGTGLRSTGLAYDRVSSRFVVADGQARKLVILDERSNRSVDLVTSASAGFFDITALEIDPLRGDLWVVSAEASRAAADRAPATALHKLQLVSGRPLERILVPDDSPAGPSGGCRRHAQRNCAGARYHRSPDSASRRAQSRRHGHAATRWRLKPCTGRRSNDLCGLRVGIARVDITSGAATSVTGSPELQLGGLERVRWARDSLIGVQRLPDGSRRSVRIRFVNGGPVTIAVLEGNVPPSAGHAATVSGDEFFFVVQQPGGDSQDVVVRRARLR